MGSQPVAQGCREKALEVWQAPGVEPRERRLGERTHEALLAHRGAFEARGTRERMAAAPHGGVPGLGCRLILSRCVLGGCSRPGPLSCARPVCLPCAYLEPPRPSALDGVVRGDVWPLSPEPVQVELRGLPVEPPGREGLAPPGQPLSRTHGRGYVIFHFLDLRLQLAYLGDELRMASDGLCCSLFGL